MILDTCLRKEYSVVGWTKALKSFRKLLPLTKSDRWAQRAVYNLAHFMKMPTARHAHFAALCCVDALHVHIVCNTVYAALFTCRPSIFLNCPEIVLSERTTGLSLRCRRFQILSCSRQRKSGQREIRHRISTCVDLAMLDRSLLAQFPVSIDAHIVVNAPEPATTLPHLNNLENRFSHTNHATRFLRRCNKV